MKPNQKAVAAALVMAFTSQSVILTPKAIAGEPTTYRQLVGTSVGNGDLIRAELRDYKIRVESGSMSARDSVEAMSKSMIDKNISLSDIDAYVQKTANEKEYRNFKKTLTASLKGLDADQLSPQQMSEILASTLQNSSVEGLSWSGCAGLSIGVILVVAAVVVGIVALTKTKGEARIRKQYADKRQNRTSSYNQAVFAINNRPVAIQAEIQQYQTSIQSNNQQISYNTGMISGAIQSNPNCSSDPVCAQNIINWTQQNNDLLAKNTELNGKIGTLNLELAQYNNPTYIQTLLSAEQTKYNNDMQAYNQDESNAVAMVPANKALAKKLGIGAGIGGAIGIYLIIDGAHDGGC